MPSVSDVELLAGGELSFQLGLLKFFGIFRSLICLGDDNGTDLFVYTAALDILS